MPNRVAHSTVLDRALQHLHREERGRFLDGRHFLQLALRQGQQQNIARCLRSCFEKFPCVLRLKISPSVRSLFRRAFLSHLHLENPRERVRREIELDLQVRMDRFESAQAL